MLNQVIANIPVLKWLLTACKRNQGASFQSDLCEIFFSSHSAAASPSVNSAASLQDRGMDSCGAGGGRSLIVPSAPFTPLWCALSAHLHVRLH